MAGAVRVLDRLPAGHPSRERYAALIREMSAAVIAAQGEDGLWRPELLRSREDLGPDSSASSLFCYAMAWGLNEGVLEDDLFGPAVAAAWVGLEGCIDDTGRLGWVQQIASAPGGVAADHHADYGAGAFLLAAQEVARLASP
jgi:rhamnogalacturonyl hydrolase YesR